MAARLPELVIPMAQWPGFGFCWIYRLHRFSTQFCQPSPTDIVPLAWFPTLARLLPNGLRLGLGLELPGYTGNVSLRGALAGPARGRLKRCHVNTALSRC